MNENRIQQVLEIEKQANAIRDEMISEADQLPIQAQKEAQAILEKARADSELEAQQLIANAQADQESADILSQADDKTRRTETLAKGNFNQAVAYVVARVIGRE